MPAAIPVLDTGYALRSQFDPTITAEASEHELLTALVLRGAGAWFSYGQQAADGAASGAGLVRLDPPVVQEVGIISLDEPTGAAQSFVEVARAETSTRLLPAGDPLLDGATWISGAELLPSPPPPTSVRPAPSAP